MLLLLLGCKRLPAHTACQRAAVHTNAHKQTHGPALTLVHLPPAPAPARQPTPEELQRFIDMEPTRQFGDQAAFAGAQAPEGKLPSAAPSRVLLQQLHDAGGWMQGRARGQGGEGRVITT